MFLNLSWGDKAADIECRRKEREEKKREEEVAEQGARTEKSDTETEAGGVTIQEGAHDQYLPDGLG